MNITATYKGNVVTIVNINVNGRMIYINYIDASNNLRVDSMIFDANNKIIATNCTVN